MNVSQQAATLVERTLDQFDDPSVSTASLVRTAARVARLRNDFVNLWWLNMEFDFGHGGKHLRAEAAQEFAAHFTREDWEAVNESAVEAILEERSTGGPDAESDKIIALGVEEIEAKISSLERIVTDLVPPAGMHPVDLYFRDAEYQVSRAELTGTVDDYRRVLSRVRARIFRYLSQAERELAFGQANADVFDRNRLYVERRLAEIAPEAVDQFNAACRSIGAGDGESGSQALVSCRRILKTLADRLYPPTGGLIEGVDGQQRKLTDANYVARLWQFVYERICSKREWGIAPSGRPERRASHRPSQQTRKQRRPRGRELRRGRPSDRADLPTGRRSPAPSRRFLGASGPGH